MMRLLAYFFLLVGFVLIIQVVWPVLSFKLWEITLAKEDVFLVSPQLGFEEVKGVSVQATKENFPRFVSTLKRQTPVSFEQFSLSIPSLKTNQETVFVDNNDLSLGLIHLPGTALPGEKGNLFISGHSALPILAKGGKAIFSNLQNIKKGDPIQVRVEGSQFVYKVVSIKIVDPKDVSVILPPDEQGRYITLMTCVPPGLNTKRLVVLGKLL